MSISVEKDTELVPFEFKEFSGGDNFDLPPTAIPQNASWDSLNVDFDRAVVSKRTGYNTTALQVGGVSITVSGGPVRLIDEFYDVNQKQWIIIATHTKVYTFDTTLLVLTDRTPAVPPNGVLTEAYVGASFFFKYFVTNNIDQPFYWDGVAALFVYLTATGAPLRAMTVKSFGAHLLWGGIKDSVLGEKPSREVWSDFQNGLVYNSGDAGSVDLEDTSDGIIAHEIIQNFLAIGRDKSIWNAQFIGTPFFYRFDRKVDVDGISGARLFLKTPLGIVGLSKNNVILYDGGVVRYIGTGITTDILQLSGRYIRNGHVVYNDGLYRIEIFVSSRPDGLIEKMYAFYVLYIQAYFKGQVSELGYPGFKEVQVIEFILKGQSPGFLTFNLLAFDDGFNQTVYGPYTIDMTKVPIPRIYLNAQGRYFSIYPLNNNLNETFEIRTVRLYYKPRTVF